MSLLQSSVYPPSTLRSSPSLSCTAAHPIASSHRVPSTSNSFVALESLSLKTVNSISSAKNNRRKGVVGKVRSSLETAGATVGQVTEVTKDTFWPIVNAAGDKTVVLDMYTQWCGPCKVIAPKFQELSEKYLDVVFLKLDCNQENKPLAKELGIRVVPTFKILKHKKIVKEVTGAKYDDLVAAIDTVRAT
ncbi:hypothetical protein Gohar_000992 [Gossypium harknessii]|uniref:Thioredoxin domain-containing protein n=1 Tax=Gossypium harknessii TaxID=34285 RepID=A0A7J9I3X5_9ROSI|nr:hypothetical protein [Gossypium harknessii]